MGVGDEWVLVMGKGRSPSLCFVRLSLSSSVCCCLLISPTRPSPSPSSWSLTAKEQLISLITFVVSADSSLRKRIRCAADTDVSHRKIFVHDLGWDTTCEVFVSTFEPFGKVEASNLVMDKLTGKAKGNGFVLFKTCRAALKALREPKKTIGSRCASVGLAPTQRRHRLNHGPVERFKEG
ncbi:hypothetical protein ACLB2K_059719 [Fragaria x ananassa]